jgi:hypothetical protein
METGSIRISGGIADKQPRGFEAKIKSPVPVQDFTGWLSSSIDLIAFRFSAALLSAKK